MRTLLVLALIALPAGPLGAEPPRGEVLEAIEVQGNARTARDVVVGALGVRPGDRIDPASLPLLRQRLLNLRIFYEVDVTVRPSQRGLVLEVAVKERWTLIPIPIVSGSDGTFQAGVLLLETNLLGRRKVLAVSGLYSPRGPSGFLYFRDPAVMGTRALLAVELLAVDQRRERAEALEVVQAWRDRRIETSLRTGLRIGRRLEPRVGPFAVFRRSGSEDGYAPPPPAGTDLGLAADLDYDGQDYQDWFNAGPLLRATVRRSFPALGSDRSFTSSNVRLTWSVPVARHHAASMALAGLLVDGDPLLDPFVLGGRPGTRGFRADGLWAERAVTAALDYQVPIWRPGWGTLTALGFVDAGVTSWEGERTRYVAPGAGVRLYVRNVALPAFGLDVAWSSDARAVVPSFFIGLR